MISWLLILLKTTVLFFNVKSQRTSCPSSKGLFYKTDPNCFVYYQCKNQIQHIVMCLPWQRFDIHTLMCREQNEVDCNPQYAGLWRAAYGSPGGFGIPGEDLLLGEYPEIGGLSGTDGAQGVIPEIGGPQAVGGIPGSGESKGFGESQGIESLPGFGVRQGIGGPQDIGGIAGFGGSQGIGGIPGYGGSQGIGGIPGFGGSQGIGGIPGYGGSQGIGGVPGFGGSQDIGGIPEFGGSQGIGGIPGFGGSQGIGGIPGLGGSQGIGGIPGFGGPQGIGGIPGFGGSQGIGGIPGYGGSQGILGIPGYGGSQGVGGIPGYGGSQGLGGIPGYGGSQGIGGIPGFGGSQGIGGIPEFGGSQGLGGGQELGGSQGIGASQGLGGVPFGGSIPGTGGLPEQEGQLGVEGIPENTLMVDRIQKNSNHHVSDHDFLAKANLMEKEKFTPEERNNGKLAIFGSVTDKHEVVEMESEKGTVNKDVMNIENKKKYWRGSDCDRPEIKEKNLKPFDQYAIVAKKKVTFEEIMDNTLFVLKLTNNHKHIMESKNGFITVKGTKEFTNSFGDHNQQMWRKLGFVKTNNRNKRNILEEISGQERSGLLNENNLQLPESKQQNSFEGHWYWCGSGRFVFVPDNNDGDNVCLQLQDPEFIDREGAGNEIDGHTYVGSNMIHK